MFTAFMIGFVVGVVGGYFVPKGLRWLSEHQPK